MIYLDNNATTRPHPEVLEAITRALGDSYANPSSVHKFGQAVRHQIECARAQVAQLLGCNPKEVIFTSGGTESINLAIRGAAYARPERKRLVTTSVEHSATLRVVEKLASEGFEVDYVGVDSEGRLNEGEWDEKISDRTGVVSIIHANNETGALFDVERLAQLAEERGAIVHIDAVQSAGKIPIEASRWPAHLVSIAAHKFHGPKGAGALFIRRRTRLEPMIVGGSQERDLRGGTENTAGIVGMGVAAEIARREGAGDLVRTAKMRDTLESGILARLPFARVNAGGAPRLGNTSNISFEHLQAEAILLLLSEAGICASSGAACSSGSLEPSHVLQAMGIPQTFAHGAIRFSLSRHNTLDEVNRVAEIIPSLLSPLLSLAGRT